MAGGVVWAQGCARITRQGDLRACRTQGGCDELLQALGGNMGAQQAPAWCAAPFAPT